MLSQFQIATDSSDDKSVKIMKNDESLQDSDVSDSHEDSKHTRGGGFRNRSQSFDIHFRVASDTEEEGDEVRHEGNRLGANSFLKFERSRSLSPRPANIPEVVNISSDSFTKKQVSPVIVQSPDVFNYGVGNLTELPSIDEDKLNQCHFETPGKEEEAGESLRRSLSIPDSKFFEDILFSSPSPDAEKSFSFNKDFSLFNKPVNEQSLISPRINTSSVVSLSAGSIEELKELAATLKSKITQANESLISEMQRKDHLNIQQCKLNLRINAVLQSGWKNRIPPESLRFSLQPYPPQYIEEWKQAMRRACLYDIPDLVRRYMWIGLADDFLHEAGVDDFNKIKEKAFDKEWVELDSDLKSQIKRDLHRTGYDELNQRNRAIGHKKLKSVLFAYCRWNLKVNYVQGFNTMASVLLDVLENDESGVLKLMIYMLEGIQPTTYYYDDFVMLQIDAQIIQDLVSIYVPDLHQHLERLRMEHSQLIGYEDPPLIDSYSMQWMIMMFATWLEIPALLRLWDVILLQGNQVMFKAAILMWKYLRPLLLVVDSAEDVHQAMGGFRYSIQHGLPSTLVINANLFIKELYELDDINIHELRAEKLKYFKFPSKTDLYDDVDSSGQCSKTKQPSKLSSRWKKLKEIINPWKKSEIHVPKKLYDDVEYEVVGGNSRSLDARSIANEVEILRKDFDKRVEQFEHNAVVYFPDPIIHNPVRCEEMVSSPFVCPPDVDEKEFRKALGSRQ